MEHGGNAKVNSIFEARLTNINEKPNNSAKGGVRELFIKEKYERRKYYDAAGFAFQRPEAPPQPKEGKHHHRARRHKKTHDRPESFATASTGDRNWVEDGFDQTETPFVVIPIKEKVTDDEDDWFSEASDSSSNRRRQPTNHRASLGEQDLSFPTFPSDKAFSKVDEYFSEVSTDASDRVNRRRPSLQKQKSLSKKKPTTTMAPRFQMDTKKSKPWGKSVQDDDSDFGAEDADVFGFDIQPKIIPFPDESQMTEEEKKKAKAERRKRRREARARARWEESSDEDSDAINESQLKRKVPRKKKWSSDSEDSEDEEESLLQRKVAHKKSFPSDAISVDTKEQNTKPDGQEESRGGRSVNNARSGAAHQEKHSPKRFFGRQKSGRSLSSNESGESKESKTSTPSSEKEESKPEHEKSSPSPKSVIEESQDRGISRNRSSAANENGNQGRGRFMSRSRSQKNVGADDDNHRGLNRGFSRRQNHGSSDDKDNNKLDPDRSVSRSRNHGSSDDKDKNKQDPDRSVSRSRRSRSEEEKRARSESRNKERHGHERGASRDKESEGMTNEDRQGRDRSASRSRKNRRSRSHSKSSDGPEKSDIQRLADKRQSLLGVDDEAEQSDNDGENDLFQEEPVEQTVFKATERQNPRKVSRSPKRRARRTTMQLSSGNDLLAGPQREKREERAAARNAWRDKSGKPNKQDLEENKKDPSTTADTLRRCQSDHVKPTKPKVEAAAARSPVRSPARSPVRQHRARRATLSLGGSLGNDDDVVRTETANHQIRTTGPALNDLKSKFEGTTTSQSTAPIPPSKAVKIVVPACNLKANSYHQPRATGAMTSGSTSSSQPRNSNDGTVDNLLKARRLRGVAMARTRQEPKPVETKSTFMAAMNMFNK